MDSDSGPMDSDSHLMDSDSGLMDSDSDSGLVDSDSLPDSRVRTHSNTGHLCDSTQGSLSLQNVSPIDIRYIKVCGYSDHALPLFRCGVCRAFKTSF